MCKSTILVEKSGPVTTVLIDRAERRNALDRASSRALAEAFASFERDDEARVAVLAGRGGAFCAGADLHELADGELYEPWATGRFGPTRGVPAKPVIAAVEGHACAGGLGLALWCDLRVVDDSAVFGVFSRRWGVPMSDGTTVRLPRLIGLGRALDMLLTGRPVHAAEALRIGLADRPAPAGEALQTAMELAAQIAAHPWPALVCDRRSAYEQLPMELAEALRNEELGSRAARHEAASGAARFSQGEGRHGEAAESDRDD
jgi:enoyl-CoA hydratase